MPDQSDSPTKRIADRVSSELTHILQRARTPGLHLVATPIGNLGDITLRALAVLATADIVYAEDTRHSGKLLSHFGIRTKLKPYHEHNAAHERPAILAALADQQSIALISDAGMPLVSDPGYKLVRDCAAEGHLVDCIPGASAPLCALVTSGLPTDTFLFAGFLPVKSSARQTRIAELTTIPATLILFEAPTRLPETLNALSQGLGDRPAAVARELTKLNEELARGTLASLQEEFSNRDSIKGEVVIVISPPQPTTIDDDAIVEAVTDAMRSLSLRDAAKVVSDDLKVPRKRVYDLGLKLRQTRQADDLE